jgi:hypothetical protein
MQPLTSPKPKLALAIIFNSVFNFLRIPHRLYCFQDSSLHNIWKNKCGAATAAILSILPAADKQ